MGSVPMQNMSTTKQRGVFMKIQELELKRISEAKKSIPTEVLSPAPSASKTSTPSVVSTQSQSPSPASSASSQSSARSSLNPSAITGFRYDVATSQENAYRNRYINVFPWDSNRVQLTTIGSRSSDYINASYVHLSSDHNYIAAQGPLRETAHHFWWMSFVESEKQGNDIIVIGMVTPLEENGMIKCFKYWPSQGEQSQVDLTDSLVEDGLIEANSGRFELSHVSQAYDEEGDFVVTELELKYGDRHKKVYHYYYSQWADTKVPPSIEPLIVLSNKITQIKEQNAPNPIIPIIHCSAGVGRTGTFIVLDYLIQYSGKQNWLTKWVSGDVISESVSRLREQRMMMVQTIHQFNYLYKALEFLRKQK